MGRKLIWVTVDRDKHPDLVKRFNVSAYPTLLAIGDQGEKVHRFEGFQKPEAFMAELGEALRRDALYRKGEEWDRVEERPAMVCDGAKVATFPAPSEDVPGGLAVLGDQAWVIQAGGLHRLDRATLKASRTLPIEGLFTDLCSDGKLLYALPYSWTSGDPILVIDPATGETLRSLPIPDDRKQRYSGAKGIAWRSGKLHVLEGMSGLLHEVDPATGKISRTLKLKVNALSGLAFDGRHLVTAGRSEVLWLDPGTGEIVRRLPVHYPLRCVEAEGNLLYLMEQPVSGFDRTHQRVRVWPRSMLVHVVTLAGEPGG